MKDICVAIRSVGERTEPLVYHACKKEIPIKYIYQIQGQSLSEGTKMACELAISSGMKWLLFVGGDYIPVPGFISLLAEQAKDVDEKVMFVKGVINDKFLMEQRADGGGPMLQRVDLLKEWLRVYDKVDNGRTTEAQFHAHLKNQGYYSKRTKVYIARHDFEQRYQDIYRSCFVYGKKKKRAEYLLPRWATMGVDDHDYEVCRYAYLKGRDYKGKVLADFKIDYGFNDSPFADWKKPEIDPKDFDSLIERSAQMKPPWI